MAVAELEAETLLTSKEESQWVVVWRRFRKHKLAVVGGIVLLCLIAMSLFASWVAPYDPLAQNVDANGQRLRNASFDRSHIMGTDTIGRDVFSRLLHAGRISLLVAFSVTIITETIGALLGAISGYYGGMVDSLIQRFVEFLITIPTLPLLLAFSAMLRGIEIPGVGREYNSVAIIILVLTFFGWTGSCRLVRGMVLSLREMDFIEASRALGMSDLRIIIRHMIPNSMAPIIVNATLGLGGVIIIESALSFLGFGVQLPTATWGNMLGEYQQDMWTQPAKVFFPGLTIFLVSLSFNYVGDGLRDALDPRLKM
ncbi:MAG: ABC transporter permease [Chloroflexi bacterium]|nr:ABC transporter permease [Chloroflexota bacterium]